MLQRKPPKIKPACLDGSASERKKLLLRRVRRRSSQGCQGRADLFARPARQWVHQTKRNANCVLRARFAWLVMRPMVAWSRVNEALMNWAGTKFRGRLICMWTPWL